MKKTISLLCLALSLLTIAPSMAQDKKATKTTSSTMTDADKQSAMNDRMAKARAAKAAKKAANDATGSNSMSANTGMKDDKMSKSSMSSTDKMAKASKPTMKEEKATPADYKAPVDPSKKGPNGEKVMTGPRGGKYYINKNGNKTYVSSNRD